MWPHMVDTYLVYIDTTNRVNEGKISVGQFIGFVVGDFSKNRKSKPYAFCENVSIQVLHLCIMCRLYIPAGTGKWCDDDDDDAAHSVVLSI